MRALNKRYLPLTFLILVSLSWGVYYQTSGWINDFGASKYEWFYLIDGLLVLPLLCFLCFKNRKEATVKAITYACIVVLVGSYIIPEENQFVWSYLEDGRYLVIAAYLLVEIVTIVAVIFAIKASLSKGFDPDLAISRPIEKIFGRGIVSELLNFEARIWTYLFFSRRIKCQDFEGVQHFSVHLKDGAQSNLFGFILLILFELPLVHLLIHFLWSPYAANIVSTFTLLGLVFFIAEYKAISIRPVSITENTIVIRYGLWNTMKIPVCAITSVNRNSRFIKRNSQIKRYNASGHPNVAIQLKNYDYQTVYLGLDDPDKFIQTANTRIALD